MDLQQCRARIDQIDAQIVQLFCERMKVVEQVAAYKKANHLPVLQTDREAQVLDRVAQLAGPEFGDDARSLFVMMMNLSKNHQNTTLGQDAAPALSEQLTQAMQRGKELKLPKKIKVACQGVPGAYSQKACLQFFSDPQITFLPAFDDVFSAIESGEADFGVLPIENSTAGSVTAVYDLMKKHNFHIFRANRVKVDHALLVKPGVKRGEITQVYSHEQGLAQCAEFFRQNPQLTPVKYPNTAAAAKFVSESPDRGVAAIASDVCASLYGLEVLEQGVQDAKSNYTRFICISKELIITPDAQKVSLAFTLPHRVGTLNQLIAQIATMNLNLTKLESRPIPDTDFEFMFYIDIACSLWDPKVFSFICKLHQSLSYLEFLGNYEDIKP